MVGIIWFYIVVEPIQWLFYSFFRPSKLRSGFKNLSLFRRAVDCLRLYFPFVFLSYFSAIVIKFIVLAVVPLLAQTMNYPLLPIIPSVAIFMFVGIIVSTIIDVPLGIALSLAMSVTSGFAWPIILGTCIGTFLAFNAKRNLILQYVFHVNTIFLAIIVLFLTRITFDILSAIISLLYIIMLFFFIIGNIFRATSFGSERKIGTSNVAFSVMLIILVVILLLIIIDLHNTLFILLGIFPLLILVIAGLLWLLSFGSERREAVSAMAATAGSISLFLIASVGTISNFALLRHFDIVLPLVVSYALVFFRPHTYVIDSLSMTREYFRVRRDTTNVFAYLHQSALYWDELTYFPLPFLKRILLISAQKDIERTLQDVHFIMNERPRQSNTAHTIPIEIALCYLERVISLKDIALVSGWFDEAFPETAMLSVFRASEVQLFARLRDVSREAARAIGFLRWQGRLDAVETMIAVLNKVYNNNSLGSREFDKRIRRIIQHWLTVTKRDLEELENNSDKTEKISNVYQPGLVLRLQDSLFVGRGDIARYLDESLKEVKHRSTFLLYGERRMGKTSLLLQLTNRLGSSYLPIFYDLQSQRMTSGADAFLHGLAENIQDEISLQGIIVRNLNSASLKDSLLINENAAYDLFNRWFDGVEKELEKAERTILICFDEYEVLAEVGSFSINLLLDWLRSTIQNRSHIAFLFCGVRTFDELGTEWVNHFVNVRAIKVSFLQEAEARALITYPIPGFPGQEIFGKEVIEEILRVTGCHPFLIQATCSVLVTFLNEKGRMQAELQDVTSIIATIIESWSAYFYDLWRRSDQQQQICLQLLTFLNAESLQQLAQYSGIDEKLLRKTLQLLQQRDLVFFDKNVYRIAVPMWNEWLHQNTLDTDTWKQLHDSILKTALIIQEGTIRQTLFSQGTITALDFPHLSPTLVYELLKTYMESHPNINIEYQESTQALRLHPQTANFVQNISTHLESLIQITHRTLVNEEFEKEVQKLFQLFSSSVDVRSTYQYVSKDFPIFLLYTQHIFENMHIPVPTPVIVSPYTDISEKSIDHIRHLFMSGNLGADVRIAILLLFCDADKLRQVKQVLTKTLRAVFARDVVVMNQNDFLDIVCAKEPSQVLRHLVLSQVSLTAVDPYIITGATPVHFFFGREPQLREIADHITTTSYAIIGGRRIGKTSMASCLHLSRLPARGFRTIYQVCANMSSYDSFIKTKIRNWRPEPPVNAPMTFEELFETPPHDRSLVLLLDEADKLVPEDRENGWRIFNILRALINEKRIQVVLSGERTLREALRDPHSPLFNLANEMLLGPLDFQAVSELVIRPMKQLEIKVVDETAIVRHIYDVTSGHPNVVQRLCRRLIDQLNARESRCITLSDVVAITDDPGFQEFDFLQTYWDAATPLERIITLALSHQTGTYRLEEIHKLVCEQTSIKPGMGQTKEALDRLVDLRSLLKRSQEGYSFSIEAFPRILLNTTTRADFFPVLVEEYEKLE